MPSITLSSFLSIKLNSKNYLAWKTQFTPILNFQDLHGFIDGSIPSPSKTTSTSSTDETPIPNPDFDKWFKKDQFLQSWLLASISEEVYPLIIGLDSSRAVWQALGNDFGSVSQNHQLQLHIELQELKKSDISIFSYLQKAKSLADELSVAGRPISTVEFNAIIYRNIGYEYHPIITALNLHPDPVSFYELRGHLVAHELLLKELS